MMKREHAFEPAALTVFPWELWAGEAAVGAMLNETLRACGEDIPLSAAPVCDLSTGADAVSGGVGTTATAEPAAPARQDG